MNLYLISQETNDGYDTYDSAVVVAESEEAAKLMHPGGYELKENSWPQDTDRKGFLYSWAPPADVKVRLIGVTDQEAGVICASFNAG